VKRMQRKLIVIILALVMAVGLLPAVTLPAMALPAMNDASIGDTQYATLEEAVTTAQSGETVKVLRDINLTNAINIAADKSLTLDLNGYTVSRTIDSGSTVLERGVITITGGNLTVVDSSAEAGGRISGINGLKTARGVCISSGSLTLESGTIYGQYAGIYEYGNTAYDHSTSISSVVTIEGGNLTGDFFGIYLAGMGAELHVTGGTISGTDSDSAAISGNGSVNEGTNINYGDTVINISDGVITAGGAAIYHPQSGTVTISGGTFTGGSTLSIKDGTWTISGGTFTANGTFADPAAANNNGSEDTGAALSITSNPAYAGPTKGDYISMDISGGTFISENGYALYEGIAVNSNVPIADASFVTTFSISGGMFAGAAGKDAVSINAYTGKTITGGYFTSDPLNHVALGYIRTAGTWNVGGVTYTYTVIQESAEVIMRSIAPTNGVEVIINGESQTAGTSETTTNTNGQTITTVTVDTDKLNDILEEEGNGSTIIIPVTGDSDIAAGVLTGEMIKTMESKEATLVVQTDSASYTLPASEINIDAVSEELGTDVSLSDITVTVEIANSSDQTVTVVENAAEEGGFSIVVPAVDFTITCTYDGKTVDVNSFNSYVERLIAIPSGVDPNKITTGIVVKPDGTTYHVPTQVVVVNGVYYAKINSLTNSTYTVIWNPIEFADVANHWAKDAINNMGSRMVVNGFDGVNYAPDKNITRAEFAAIIVRALGLASETGQNSFSDVRSTDWYYGYIETASLYGVITGYGNGTFGPNDKITREQAMTMIARAMKITGLQVSLTDSEITAMLDKFTDGISASDYAEEGIAACLKTGVVSGRSNSTVAPKAFITRAEVAVIVQRLLQKSELI